MTNAILSISGEIVWVRHVCPELSLRASYAWLVWRVSYVMRWKPSTCSCYTRQVLGTDIARRERNVLEIHCSCSHIGLWNSTSCPWPNLWKSYFIPRMWHSTFSQYWVNIVIKTWHSIFFNIELTLLLKCEVLKNGIYFHSWNKENSAVVVHDL